MKCHYKWIALALILVTSCLFATPEVQVVGKGYLEKRQDSKILYLEGTPYERGYQHGSLLAEEIEANLKRFISEEKTGFTKDPIVLTFHKSFPSILSHIPKHLSEELRGLADGANLSFKEVLMMNLFPEMFHCIGITAQKKATRDHSLYHIRVLDYEKGDGLQDSAVLIVTKPEGKYTYITVSYAGFIGVVTGMNEKKIAIGEVGGDGYGDWEGMPMAFMLKEILENSADLETVKQILQETPRTCEYFYLISDGEKEEALGVYATTRELFFTRPNEIRSSHIKRDSCCISEKHPECPLLFQNQPSDCLVIDGFGHPERGALLRERINQFYGEIDFPICQKLIAPPATGETNLHNAIFHPSSLTLWVSHKGEDQTPASKSPYVQFCLSDFLESKALTAPKEAFFSKFSLLKEREDWETIRELGQKALADPSLDAVETAQIHARLASNAFYLGNYKEVKIHATSCQAIAKHFSDPSLWIRSLYLLSAHSRALGNLSHDQTKFQEAYKWINQALELLKEDSPISLKAKVYFNAGAIFADDPNGNLDQAADYMSQAMDLFKRASCKDDYIRAGIRKGKILLLQGNITDAMLLLTHLEPLIVREKTRVHLLYVKAQILMAKGEKEKAKIVVEKAITIAERLGMMVDKSRLEQLI